MEIEKFNFDTSFQMQIIKLMIKDDIFLSKCNTYLREEFFENEFLAYFYKKTCAYYRKFQTVPKVVYFINEIRKFSDQKQKEYISWVLKIFNIKIDSENYLKETLEEFIKRNLFVRFYEDIASVYSQDSTKAYKEALKRVEEINSFKFDDQGDLISLDDYDRLLERDRDVKLICPIGIPDIDFALDGGVRSGEMCVFLADTNVGKSIVLVNIGVLSILKERKVLHINLEGKSTTPLYRYLCRMTGIPYNEVKTGVFQREEDRDIFDRAKKLYRDRVYVLHMASFRVTTEMLKARIDDIKKSFDFDVIIVDYGDLIITEQHMETRHQHTAVFRWLQGISDTYSVPVFTASQATRPERDFNTTSRWVNLKDMSESYEKVRVAPIVISLNRIETEERENKLRVMLCKNRDGVRNIKVGCYTNYTKMIPYSPTLGFFEPGKELVISESTASPT